MHRPAATRRRRLLWSVGALVGLGCIVVDAGSGVSEESPESPPERRWLDPSGSPLPFQSHEEITDFLNEATVISVADIPEGVTKPKEVLLERNGVRARAAFRYVSKKSQSERLPDGAIEKHFRDDFTNEVAAYELSRLMGMTAIPPAVLREVEGTPGSIQIWVEGTTRLKDFIRDNPGKADPTSRSRYLRHQVRDMNIFDNLIRNIDRNQGNIMWDAHMNLWLIDHTRSFGGDDTLPWPDEVVKCSRRFWTALQELDPKQVRSTLAPYLGGLEIKALLRRHKKLVQLLGDKIQEEGEEAVIFTHAVPPGPETAPAEGASAAAAI